jgi:hypothetical protein
MDRIARLARPHFLDGFEAEEDGTSTIEFVVLLPLFIMFMMLVTNTNLLSLRQIAMMGETGGIVSAPSMTPSDAGIFSNFGTIAATPPTVTEAVEVSGFDAVVVAGNASAPVALAVMGSSEDASRAVSMHGLVEPSR